jgi:hypothetical protein
MDYRQAVQHLYDRIIGLKCAYCGENATCEEHVFPAIAMFALLDIGNFRSLIMPACNEYNLLAAAECFKSFNDETKFHSASLKRSSSK